MLLKRLPDLSAYELRHEPSRTGRAPTAPLPSRTKSPVPGLTREHKTEGVVLKHSPAPSEELYITTEPKESAAASHRSSHGLDLEDLDKLARNISKFNPSMPNSQNVQAYLQDIVSMWKCDLKLYLLDIQS